MTKVFLADDHAVLRQGIRQILAAEAEIEVVGEAGNYEDLTKKVCGAGTDVLVMDLSMPGGDGVETIRQLHEIKPEMSVLVLSMHSEDQYALRVLRAGASGYLTKECAPEQLVTAIDTVKRGEKFLTPSVEKLLGERRAKTLGQPLHMDLSDREFQVLVMIGRGETLTDISKKFNLSIKTISTYRNRILKKMSAKSNADLIRYVIENSLTAAQ